MAMLEKHAHSRNTARNRGDEHRRFLGQNFNPKVPGEGVDFRLATEEETTQRWCVDESQLDEDESESAEQDTGLIHIQVTPQMLAQLMSGRTGQQECGPVVRSLAPVPAYDPAMPGYTSAGQSIPVYTAVTTATYGSAIGVSAQSTAYISLDIGTSSVGQTSAASTSASPIVSAPTSVYSAPVSSCPVSVPVYVPSFGDTFISSGLDSVAKLSSA
ncbi:uncharacterized protein LOC123541161 [Mercenaria mercenaria]|uniref:uncharacterized protein LOC123541161 n=1 Tax=Mercenaria mercenaria TaxID=6596 RepID=UPI00234F2609|nr:uncharacterized protein LOC123541161 [Mercenaria mercenaria]